MTTENQAMTGYALFIRHSSGAPTAITMNLGRRASAPDERRPLMLRISVRLLHPSKDGLAQNMEEIEQLAQLSELTFNALKAVEGEWVVMTTVKGLRSWILYSARSDGAMELVQQAFSGQSQYAPTVEIESDPQWTTYSSMYPTPEEQEGIRWDRSKEAAMKRCRVMTPQVVKKLQEQGDNLLEPRKVDFFLFFPTMESRDSFGELASASKFTVHKPAPSERDGQPVYLIVVSRVELPTVSRVLGIESWLIHHAVRRGGKFDGWGCHSPQVPPAG